MKIHILALLTGSLILLAACSHNPYSSHGSKSQLMIERDIHFMEMYMNTLCTIKRQHEWEEISGGKCLALYYDFIEDDRFQEGKKEVSQRVGYILNNPEKFDNDMPGRITKATVEIGVCNSYIKSSCM